MDSSPSLTAAPPLETAAPPRETGAPRRPRRALIAIAGHDSGSEGPALALACSLGALGIETIYLGRETRAQRVAAVAAARRADAVELFLARNGGVTLLRELLRELTDLGRRDVSIVVHRLD